MIISKKAIPRRTVLRGLGALALPLLDSMVPALTAVAEGGRPDQPLRRDVRAERHDHEELAAGRRGRGYRARRRR